MKLIILAVACLLAVALAAPPVDQKEVKITRSEFEQEPEGGYKFGFETDDGTSKQETGELKSVPDEENKPHAVIVSRGSFSWVDLDGKSHTVTYYADETGYHAESEDIPKAQ